jgi:hypothetical protein
MNSKHKEITDLRLQLEDKIYSELRKIYFKIDGSHMENVALQGHKSEQVDKILDNKIDITDFREKMNQKSNKNDIEMLMRQI